MLNFTLFERLFNQITTLQKKKSIKSAIFWGQAFVNMPILAIIFGLPSLAVKFEDFFLEQPFDLSTFWRVIIFFSVCIISILLAWLYWSLAIPKWRKWAYKNVAKKDWEALMWAAVDANLTWTPGHPLEATEIRNEEDKGEITSFYKHISKKIRREKAVGSYSEDKEIPIETRYFLNKKRAWIELIAIVFIALIGLGNIIIAPQIVLKLIGAGIIGYLIYDIKDSPVWDILKKDEAQIILNEKGLSIKKKNLSFYSWRQIEFIDWEEEEKKMIVCIENKDQKEEEFSKIPIKLELIDVHPREFLKCAKVYIGRHDRNNLAPLN